MTDVISKYGTLHTINDEVMTDAMLKRFTELPEARHQDLWIRDAVVGDVGIFIDDRYPNKVIEVVMGAEESSVTTLFETSPIFFSRSELADARKDIMLEIGVATASLPSMIAIKDEGRGRDVVLREMSTAQLIDILVMARKGQFGLGKV
jgi:hypothetical protein